MQEFSAANAEESVNLESRFGSSSAVPSKQEVTAEGNTQLRDIAESLDGQTYFLGEVPQSFLSDPQAFLPLNSDKLIGSVDMIDKLLSEMNEIIQEEVSQIQRHQKKINSWEERIEKNKALIQKNQNQIKQNLVDISYDKKNRDYWLSRAEQVILDYEHASAANRENEWAWLVKKYGFKNPDGSFVDYKNSCIEEICEGAANNLASEYKVAGNRYEMSKKDKEVQNTRMIHENGALLTTNEQLQSYISTLYTNEIEPLQDGVLLMKELGVKFTSLSQDPAKATYGALRSWAESFLDEFLKTNPKVLQSVVTEFRRLSSIPLPAKNS